MGLSGLFVGVTLVVCVCGVVTSFALQAVGPCIVDPGKALFNCNHKKLKEIPVEIWPNVTILDLSHNKLNINHPHTLRALQQFQQLVHLNLSANYLPLLAKGSLCNLPALEVLDISRCRLTEIETGAFEGLPRLQRVFLGHNRLQRSMISTLKKCKDFACLFDEHRIAQANLSPDKPQETWRGRRSNPSKGYKNYNNEQEPQNEGLEEEANSKIHLRKLLVEDHKALATLAHNNTNGTTGDSRVPSHNWKFLLGVLITAIVLSIIVAVVAKFKLFHRYLTSYRHSRFSNIDTVSQFESDVYDVGYSPRGGAPTGSPRDEDDDDLEGGGGEEDDDGFIEDNYIQPNERDRASRAAEHQEKDDEDVEFELDDDDMFTIG